MCHSLLTIICQNCGSLECSRVCANGRVVEHVRPGYVELCDGQAMSGYMVARLSWLMWWPDFLKLTVPVKKLGI